MSPSLSSLSSLSSQFNLSSPSFYFSSFRSTFQRDLLQKRNSSPFIKSTYFRFGNKNTYKTSHSSLSLTEFKNNLHSKHASSSSNASHFVNVDQKIDLNERNVITFASNSTDNAPLRKEEEEGEEFLLEEKPFLRNVVWGVYSFYISWLLLLPFAPGDPVWNIQPETLRSISELSLNFFFILPTLNFIGVDYMIAPDIHPMSESLFNFVNAWSLMFGPLLFSEPRSRFVKGLVEPIWLGVVFLTNIFLIPYMALRLNAVGGSKPNVILLPMKKFVARNARWFGFVGFFVGLVSIWWAAYARNDGGNYGDIFSRFEFLVQSIQTDRVAYAFLWDLLLYSVFQVWLITDLGNYQAVKFNNSRSLFKYLRFVPFFGLAAFLITMPDGSEDTS